jgi:hypothetical protein
MDVKGFCLLIGQEHPGVMVKLQHHNRGVNLVIEGIAGTVPSNPAKVGSDQ